MSEQDENAELVQIFLEEARDLLDMLSTTLQHWSEDLSNKDCFADLKRDLHTLKGGARMVNQPQLSALAHELESLCEALLSDHIPADKSTYDLICSGQDRMNLIIEALTKKEIAPPVEDLLVQFKNKIENKPEASLSVTMTVDKSSEMKPESPQELKAENPTSEFIRVKSDLLEKLNNLSIESNIIRVNLGHNVDVFSVQLNEMITVSKTLHEKMHALSPEINLPATSDVMGLMNLCKTLAQTHSTIESLLSQQSRIGMELQERLIDTRMVAFSSVVPRLSRITRMVAGELNKKIDFSVLQAEGEIDRNLLEHITPSLEHLLRNALDHGVEAPEVRIKANKPEVGKIYLKFYRMGSEVCIEIGDDGGGINLETVRKKAIRLGMLTEESVCSDENIIRYILEPGFSTREAVSEISGRGVGMDVVNTVVKGLGGNLSIESQFGIGTKFIIRLPFTTSMNRALLVVVQEKTFGVLLSNVESIVLYNSRHIKEALHRNAPILYNNKEYHLKYLGGALGLSEKPIFTSVKENIPVLFFNFSDYNAALLVDSLAGSQEVVVQALGPQFKLMDIFSGATLLADGRVLIILDAYSITATSKKQTGDLMEKRVPEKKQPVVLVVDDSVTIRTVTKNFLERHKYTVMTARDGMDALTKLEEHMPDVILLDLEMPRMNGFQFAEKVRESEKFKALPIIMITFCTGDAEKAQAARLGIAKFIGKPYREQELLDSIEHLLEK